MIFQALADPTRRAILARLGGGPAPVMELSAPTGLRLPTVMRHLSVLEEAGLIVTSKDGRVRTCAIVPEALEPVLKKAMDAGIKVVSHEASTIQNVDWTSKPSRTRPMASTS